VRGHDRQVRSIGGVENPVVRFLEKAYGYGGYDKRDKQGKAREKKDEFPLDSHICLTKKPVNDATVLGGGASLLYKGPVFKRKRFLQAGNKITPKNTRLKSRGLGKTIIRKNVRIYKNKYFVVFVEFEAVELHKGMSGSFLQMLISGIGIIDVPFIVKGYLTGAVFGIGPFIVYN
jgi:hypothetical protein